MKYHYAHPSCRTPPAVVANRDKRWRGELLVGGIDHRLCQPWVRWRRVTHVLNCTGRVSKKAPGTSEREETSTWAIIHDPHYKFSGLDWCVRSHIDRERYEETFARVRAALSLPSSVVYVHSKSGRDRSCQTVYALLRIVYGLDDRAATEAREYPEERTR